MLVKNLLGHKSVKTTQKYLLVKVEPSEYINPGEYFYRAKEDIEKEKN